MEANENPTTWEKVKTHFKKHKTAYIWGGIAVVATGVGYALGKSQGDVYNIDINEAPTLEIEGDSSAGVIGDNNEVHNTTVNMGGYTHKIVKNTSTGEVFESVNDAAESAGVPRTVMSRHINGHTDHVAGDIYEIIGVGTTG